MDSLNGLAKLKTITSQPILSVYLNIPERKVVHPSYLSSQLRSLVHQNLSENDRKYWKHDIRKIDDYLHGLSDGIDIRSMVFFTSGQNLWEILKFKFFLPSLCISTDRPYLKMIEAVSQSYPRYLVLLVDRERAKLFIVHFGEIEEQKEIQGLEVPQRVKAKTINLGRTDKIMRHIEYHLNEHLKFIAGETRKFIQGKNIHSIVVGSHKELLPKIKSHLKYPLNKMIKGEFITELKGPFNEILKRAKRVISQVEGDLGGDQL